MDQKWVCKMKLGRSASELFEETAAYYSRYRPVYPSVIIDFLEKSFSLNDHDTILDLGCGTGQLAIPFAKRGFSVLAVDPNAEMLMEGIRGADQEQVFGIWWQLGSDSSFHAPKISTLKLCVMGASFHWMDRAAVLRKLDKIIAEGGGVAVLGGAVDTWSNDHDDWNRIVRETVQSFLGHDRRAGNATYSHPTKKHEDMLLDSAFANVSVTNFSEPAAVTVDEIIGLQISTSYASPRLLGDQLEEFKGVLRERLLELCSSGTVEFVRKFEVITAFRS